MTEQEPRGCMKTVTVSLSFTESGYIAKPYWPAVAA